MKEKSCNIAITTLRGGKGFKRIVRVEQRRDKTLWGNQSATVMLIYSNGRE